MESSLIYVQSPLLFSQVSTCLYMCRLPPFNGVTVNYLYLSIISLGGFWTTVDMPLKHIPPTAAIVPPSNGGLTSSIFPIDNPDLVYKRWEDDIIWDSEVNQ